MGDSDVECSSKESYKFQKLGKLTEGRVSCVFPLNAS